MRTADPSKPPRIIDAAAQLFAERAYHEVRMDDIAAGAGVAKGTLYLHFRDKEALYLTGRREEFVALVSDVLGTLAASGRLEVADPGFSAVCLGGLIREVLQRTPRPWPPSISEQIEAHLLHGVRCRPE